MASDEGGEKSEEPTQHKLSKAREEGQVPKSMEVTSAAVLLVGGLALLTLGPLGWDRLVSFFYHYIWRLSEISPQGEDLTITSLMPWFYTAMKETIILFMPLSVIILIVGVGVNMYQVGGLMFSTKTLVPKIDKLNFIKGMGRFFKVKAIVEGLKSVFKIGIVFYIAYLVIIDHLDEFATMGGMEVAQMGTFTLSVALELYMKICIFLFILAVLDYGYQRWQFMKDMRMSKQEIKDEFKQMEGDPIIKGRIRQAQREAAKRRQLGDVPKADVVIANPTHFAIALLYDAVQNPAPVVLAKGQDLMALRIKDIAKENKVPIVENKPLAQALYKAVEVGDTIPVEFYKAVAEVLSYVYRTKKRKPSRTINMR